jgi:superfamily II DNA or RNA helicase
VTKESIQSEAVELISKHSRVILSWATGLGKSAAAIKMLNKIIQEKINCKVLLVVAESAHKGNWDEEFNKFGLSKCDLTVECFASLKKYRDSKWDVVIIDEAHHIGSDLRMDIISTIKSEYMILLSATIPNDTILYLSQIFGKFHIFNITLDDAIKAGILPKPKIYLIPLTLNRTDYNCTIIEEWGTKKLRKTIKCNYPERWKYLKNKKEYPNVQLEISCTEQQKYDYYSDKFEFYKNSYMRSRSIALKNKWLQTGSQRKVFLGELKTPIVRKFIRKVLNKRFVCFCTSINQAEALDKNHSIHSKKKNSLEIIDSFNNKSINNLFAVNMIQEGQNLTDIEVGIIIQLDGQERAFIQKFGRTLRADSPTQYIFYYENTRDEEYLDKVLEGIDSNYIQEINLNKY